MHPFGAEGADEHGVPDLAGVSNEYHVPRIKCIRIRTGDRGGTAI